MKPVFIYALNCPVTGRTRYIGKTINPTKRFTAHRTEARQGKIMSHRIHWIQNLFKQGLSPEFEMLAQVPASEWRQWEIDYVAAFRSLGCNLVNGTDGGDGFESGEKHPNFGKPGLRLGTVGWNKGIPHTAETRSKISAAKLGKKRSLESRLKQGAALKGRPSSMLGKKHRPESREKMRAAHKLLSNSGRFKSGQTPWNKGIQNGKRQSN